MTSVALDLDILHGHTDVNNIDAFAAFLPHVASHWAWGPGGYPGERRPALTQTLTLTLTLTLLSVDDLLHDTVTALTDLGALVP